MKIDPITLERIRQLIERYTSDQKEVLTELLSSMRKLSEEWDDKRSFGEMMKHIEAVSKRSIEMFEQIRIIYKKFYYDEILDIKKNLAALRM